MNMLGDVASASADAQVQLAGLATFFAGVNSGQAPNPAQLAAATAAAGQIQTDLVAMGAPAGPGVNAAGGVTKMQAAGIGLGALFAGWLICKAMK
jgi:hypothetical protein